MSFGIGRGFNSSSSYFAAVSRLHLPLWLPQETFNLPPGLKSSGRSPDGNLPSFYSRRAMISGISRGCASEEANGKVSTVSTSLFCSQDSRFFHQSLHAKAPNAKPGDNLRGESWYARNKFVCNFKKVLFRKIRTRLSAIVTSPELTVTCLISGSLWKNLYDVVCRCSSVSDSFSFWNCCCHY